MRRSRPASRRSRRRHKPSCCPLCKQPSTLFWRCRCGFAMCQRCMDENTWGLTCNGITWHCPDCGRSNGYGNN